MWREPLDGSLKIWSHIRLGIEQIRSTGTERQQRQVCVRLSDSQNFQSEHWRNSDEMSEAPRFRSRAFPTLLKPLRQQHIKYIAGGGNHSAALTAQGGVFTFGSFLIALSLPLGTGYFAKGSTLRSGNVCILWELGGFAF